MIARFLFELKLPPILKKLKLKARWYIWRGFMTSASFVIHRNINFDGSWAVYVLLVDGRYLKQVNFYLCTAIPLNDLTIPYIPYATITEEEFNIGFNWIVSISLSFWLQNNTTHIKLYHFLSYILCLEYFYRIVIWSKSVQTYGITYLYSSFFAVPIWQLHSSLPFIRSLYLSIIYNKPLVSEKRNRETLKIF